MGKNLFGNCDGACTVSKWARSPVCGLQSERVVLEELDDFAVEAAHKADAKGEDRLIGMGGDEVLGLPGPGRSSLLRPLNSGVAIVGAQGNMEKRPFRQDSRAARK